MRQTLTTIAGIAAVLSLLAIVVYTESANSPGEQYARTYGCSICHPDLFDTPWPGLDSRSEQAMPIRPVILQTINESHGWVPEVVAVSIADYALAKQQSIHAKRQESDKATSLYLAKCATCHGKQGEGTPGKYPPLRDSEWLTDTPSRLPEILQNGLRGPISVRGEQWNAVMLPPGIATKEETDTIIRYLKSQFISH